MRASSTKPIRETLERILRRHEQYSKRLNVPGDWGERAFRGWLALELFHDVLGWDASQIVFGEQFDLLFVNGDLLPVINIETKAPGHNPSNYEVNQFKRRLRTYGTLRYACMTNGQIWTALILAAPDGKQIVQAENAIDISRSSLREMESFFDPLWAKNYVKPGQ